MTLVTPHSAVTSCDVDQREKLHRRGNIGIRREIHTQMKKKTTWVLTGNTSYC